MKYFLAYWFAYVVATGFHEGWAAFLTGPRPELTIHAFAAGHLWGTAAAGALSALIWLGREDPHTQERAETDAAKEKQPVTRAAERERQG